MIDPTYLRTIYDGLISGTLHKDSASGLPHGLVGIYEDVLPPINYVNERHEFLKFFLVWALLKKEMSAGFVASLLGWTEENVFGYLARYSKWFNAPASGKYVLYHERLRSFILQKISHTQFTACNEAIIKLGQKALERRRGDEWEQYALEHLSTHLLLQAMESKDATALRTQAYSSSHWNRQIEICKGFEWSKGMLNNMMLWASKYNDDEVIECALNKLDLYHQEQNDAPRIMELVAQNDIETALQRIETFGGNNKEGLQRKFTLYMLCLMELTLLESKNKSFRNPAIEKLLNHLDKQIPSDTSIIDWNYFFPSYTIFLMGCEWARLGLDYLIVYKRTDNWDNDWITEKGPYSDSQLDVLLECARGISDKSSKNIALKNISNELSKQGMVEKATSTLQEAFECAVGINDAFSGSSELENISIELAKQGKIDEALACVRGMSYESDKCKAMTSISTELSNQGMFMEAAIAFQEALEYARSISYEPDKSNAIMTISRELSKLGMVGEASLALQEALACATDINSDGLRSRELFHISTELAKRGNFEQALGCTMGISINFTKISALKNISTELAKKGKFEQAASLMHEALVSAKGIRTNYKRGLYLENISTELARQGKVEESLECASAISHNLLKKSALTTISTKLAKLGLIEEALACVRGINDAFSESSALENISTELVKQGKIDEALACARGIVYEFDKSKAMTGISTELAKQGVLDEAASAMQEAIASARCISDESDKSNAIASISSEMAKQDMLEEATSALQEALECARGIIDELGKSNAMMTISKEMAKQGMSEEATSALQEALAFTRGIIDESDKSNGMTAISTELAKQDKIAEALECISVISDELYKTRAMSSISRALAEQGNIEKAVSFMKKALDCARGISDDSNKNIALEEISRELARQGNWLLMENTGLEITQIAARCRIWESIARNTYKQTEWEKLLQIVNELHNLEARTYFLRGISDSLTPIDCSIELILNARSYCQNDLESMGKLLQLHALHEVFFGNATSNKIKRFNRTLNIQWAIDIKKSMKTNQL
jgi:tetratricopeptide (TPR) repeat protein